MSIHDRANDLGLFNALIWPGNERIGEVRHCYDVIHRGAGQQQAVAVSDGKSDGNSEKSCNDNGIGTFGHIDQSLLFG